MIYLWWLIKSQNCQIEMFRYLTAMFFEMATLKSKNIIFMKADQAFFSPMIWNCIV